MVPVAPTYAADTHARIAAWLCSVRRNAKRDMQPDAGFRACARPGPGSEPEGCLALAAACCLLANWRYARAHVTRIY